MSAFVSNDRLEGRRYPVAVSRSPQAIFNEAFCERVRHLREERGWTAEQMATALGIPPERYRKYEYRTPMPHYLIERFALIVGRDIDQVLIGHRRTAVATKPQ